MISKEGCSVYPIFFPTPLYNLRTINFYILEEAGALTLIDSGVDTEECWETFIMTMTENGFALRDLNRIIITHSHQDHVGLINRITTIKEIPVYAHKESIHGLKRDNHFLSLRLEFFRQLYQKMGCGISGEKQVQKLKGAERVNEKNKIRGDILPLNDLDIVAGLQVIETPGHSSDHLVFFDSHRKWLFIGDHLINHISSNAIVEPDRTGRRMLTLIQYEDSLKKCLNLDIEIAFSGHGELIRNYKGLITTRLSRIHRRAEKILLLVERGISTAAQLAVAFFKELYQSEFSLVMSEIIGYLDYLEIKNKIQKELKDGVWHYYCS